MNWFSYKDFSDGELSAIIMSFDNLSKPLQDREENDDIYLRDHVRIYLGMEPNLINMNMVMLLVFREAVKRGLKV